MLFILNATNTIPSAISDICSFINNAELLSSMIVGGFTLLGVFVGNISAKRNIKYQEKLKLLVELYSEVFSAYTAAAPRFDNHNLLPFIVACEKTKLLCCQESEIILDQIIQSLTQANPSMNDITYLIVELRKSAKKELRKY